tara:strand:- start:119 stop:1810 length:1692 start_codon:yes stop_codon:yes gene_type:complete
VALVFCFCSYSNAETITVTETVIEIETGTRQVEEEYQEEVTIYTTVTETVVNAVTEEVITTNTTTSTETAVSANLMAGVCGSTWTQPGGCQDTDGDGVDDRYRATYYWTTTTSDWTDLSAYLELADTFTITYGADIWNNCPQKMGGWCGNTVSDYYTDDYTMTLKLKDQTGTIIAEDSFSSNDTPHGWQVMTDTYVVNHGDAATAGTAWAVLEELYAQLLFKGFDKGYWSGYYGPKMQDPSLTVTYDHIVTTTENITSLVTSYVESQVTSIIESQVMETKKRWVEEQYEYEVERTITREIEIPDIDTTTTVEVEVEVPDISALTDIVEVEVEVTDTSGTVIETFTVNLSDLDITTETEIPEIEVVQVETIVDTTTETAIEVETVETTIVEVETEIETALEIEVEATPEIEVEVEVEVETETEVEVETETETEVEQTEESESETEEQQEQEAEPSERPTVVAKAKSAQDRRRQIATQVAMRVMERFQGNYYTGLAQATQIALMNAIAAGSDYDAYTNTRVPDAVDWYESEQMYPDQHLPDPFAEYYSAAQDQRWNEMVDEQYGR